MANHELRITRRGDKSALWINGLNVWDLSDEHVTDGVLDAIRHAYAMGHAQAIGNLRAFTDHWYLNLPRDWKDEREEKTDGRP